MLIGLSGCSESLGTGHSDEEDHEYQHGHQHGHQHGNDHSGVDANNVGAGAFPCAHATSETLPALGLMTSLPLNWELGTDISDFAKGVSRETWQSSAISQCFAISPLDTLSPIAGLTSNDPEADPIHGLSHLAIIQPRALTPADNVALDAFVRAGGEALLVLDPMLTGHYDLPLGDPRRPIDSALYAIPPVVARWGLEVVYSPDQAPEKAKLVTQIEDAFVMIDNGLKWSFIDPEAAQCTLSANGYLARCKVGDGRATLLGDAAVFEDRLLAGENFEAMAAVFDYAFETAP